MSGSYMKIVSCFLVFGFLLSACSGVTNVTKHKVLANGTDQSESLKTLIVSKKTLFFPAGVYSFRHIVQISEIEDLTFQGEPGTVFTTSLDVIFNLVGNNKRIHFKDIKFTSTKVREDEYSDGLITNNNLAGIAGSLDGLTIEHCEFTKPRANSNGIKINAEGSGVAKNILIKDCKFYGIGRAAVETQNHIETDTVTRIFNVEIVSNTFDNIGTMGTWGLAVSTSGYSKNIRVNNNHITDVGTTREKKNDYYAIENGGASNMEIIGNVIESRKFGYKGILASNQRPKYNCTIKDNTFKLFGREDIARIRCIELNNLFNSLITNNKGTSTGLALQADNVKNCRFIKNSFACANPITMIFQNGCTGNIIRDNIADGSKASENFGTILFVDTLTTNNYCFSNVVYRTGGAEGTVGNYNGANNNTKKM